MKPWLILINDFCHDLFTGLWFGSFVTLAVLQGWSVPPGGEAAVLIGELNALFFTLCLAGLGLIIATGIARAFYYRNWDSVAMAPVKNRLLVIKHAVLGSSLLIGTGLAVWWQW